MLVAVVGAAGCWTWCASRLGLTAQTVAVLGLRPEVRVLRRTV
jgi:hypothetical protein